MNRAVLEACLPCLVALAAAVVALRLVVLVSGARLDLSRLRDVHRCQEGGVQSLAFVLTVPIFLAIVLFIVQISQLMVGVVQVNYAAFAAARAASVWVPALVVRDSRFSSQPPDFLDVEAENFLHIDTYTREGDVLTIFPSDYSMKAPWIRAAAILAVAPVCPSRDLGLSSDQLPYYLQQSLTSTRNLYLAMVPAAASNARVPIRLSNKITFAEANTLIALQWRDTAATNGTNTTVGPTYNPQGHPLAASDPDLEWEPGEAGWQDAITVHVIHHFALLPGPGRLLARQLVRSDGLPDNISSRITRDQTNYSEAVYTTPITASATMTAEGIRSLRPVTHALPVPRP